jgi:hypothetical protein
MKKEIKTPVSISIAPTQIVALEKYIKNHSPEIKNRSHAIEIAITKLLKEK